MLFSSITGCELPEFSQIRSAENPQRPVLDVTARAFTERFYGALFVGKQLGCTELTAYGAAGEGPHNSIVVGILT